MAEDDGSDRLLVRAATRINAVMDRLERTWKRWLRRPASNLPTDAMEQWREIGRRLRLLRPDWHRHYIGVAERTLRAGRGGLSD